QAEPVAAAEPTAPAEPMAPAEPVAPVESNAAAEFTAAAEAPAQPGPVGPAPAAEEAPVFPPAFPPAFEVPDGPPSEGDDERAAHTFGTEADILVHPVAAAVSAPLPPAPRRTGRRHAGKPSGDGSGASKGRRAKGDRHYDWLWEVVGILICLVIALAVFYFVQ
ncbi:hypothetical protein AB0J39_26845, partial [Microbispora sp. NPDC049633]